MHTRKPSPPGLTFAWVTPYFPPSHITCTGRNLAFTSSYCFSEFTTITTFAVATFFPASPPSLPPNQSIRLPAMMRSRQNHDGSVAMDNPVTVAFHPLEILNIPLEDAYPRYWTIEAIHERADRCKEIVTFYKSRGFTPLPNCDHIKRALEIVLIKGGFDTARAIARGRWSCRWSPQTPFPFTPHMAFSMLPPTLLWSVSVLPTTVTFTADRLLIQ